jgi:hypothetical protein
MNRHSILYIGLSYRPGSELFRNSTILAAGERSTTPCLTGSDLLTRHLAGDKVLFHRGFVQVAALLILRGQRMR